MADKAWKAAERQVAAVLGGKRQPITGRQRGDVPDVEHAWLAIEVKSTRNFPKWLREAHAQAVAASFKSGGWKLPIVVIKPHRTNVRQGYVMLQVSDFIEWFGGTNCR
jgi:hypothetical protein